MRRATGWVIAALVLLASVGAGVGAWLHTRHAGTALPEISVYSLGETGRVGPFLYCNVIDLNDCAQSAAP